MSFTLTVQLFWQCVCLKDCVEDIKHSAKKQEQDAAGRNVFNQVRTKELCNFLLRAQRTLAPSEREQPTFQSNSTMVCYCIIETYPDHLTVLFFVGFFSPSFLVPNSENVSKPL